MPKTWPLALLVALSLSTSSQPSLPLSVAWAAGGGGGGTTPPPAVENPYSLRVTVEGRAAGLTGIQLLVFKILEPSPYCGACATQTLHTETRTVNVVSERFTTQLGISPSTPLTSATLAGARDAYVTWALASLPTTGLGSMPLYPAVAASGLSPEAVISASSSTPALDIGSPGNLSGAMSTWTQADARAVQLSAPSTALRTEVTDADAAALFVDVASPGTGYGLRATANAPVSKALKIEAPSGAHLIWGRVAGLYKFEVRSDGTVWSDGVQIEKQGPKGNAGPSGSNGSDGADATLSGSQDFCLASDVRDNCASVCLHGTVAKDVQQSPCNLGNGCYANGNSGVCCTCGKP